MSAIDVENAKQIRTPFEVYCTFMSREDNNLTMNNDGADVKVRDTNYAPMLQDTSINMRELADLANGGFRADGTVEFDDGVRTGSQSEGKLGIRTDIGGAVQIDITGEKVINSLTVTTSEGNGEILDLNSFRSVGIDTSKAYTKNVPQGANYTRVQRIDGESVVSNGVLIDATPTNVVSSNGQSLNVNYGTLRSAGNVHDELDLVNGKIIRRVGVADENASWSHGSSTVNANGIAYLKLSIYSKEVNIEKSNEYLTPNIHCASTLWSGATTDEFAYNGSTLFFRFKTSKTSGITLNDGLARMRELGAVCNYPLAEPIEEEINVNYDTFKVGNNITFESKANDYGINVPLTSSVNYGTFRTYDIKRINVIPVNAQSISLLFSANEDSRVSISSITAGLTLEFDNENLVSCTLALRSNLDIIEPTWQVSEIELQAYYPDDIAEAIGNVGDNVPIMYYAGYVGDYSTPRTFYMSEKASMEHNVVTIKGVDASNRLEDCDIDSAIMISQNNQTKQNIYEKLRSAVRLGLGEGVTISEEAMPSISGLDTTRKNLIWNDTTANKIVADIMNKSHEGDFYPVFIDAGIPTIKWSLPTSKWDIYEEDCADVVEEYDRNIDKLISSNSDYPIQTDVTFGGNQLIDSIEVDPYTIQSYDFNGFVYSAGVTNASSVIQVTPKRIAWVSGGGTTCNIWGYPCNISQVSDAVTAPRLGVTEAIEPNAFGRVFDGDGNMLYPNYESLFGVSNLSGSFTFKGDPRMQPRDVFTFHRLDGTSEICTIETITMTHEGGGTSAQVTYRKGVV